MRNYIYIFLITILKLLAYDHSELASLYTVALSAVNSSELFD